MLIDLTTEGDRYAGSIVDTLREALLLLDGDLTVVMANESFCRAFGIGRPELLGRRLTDVGGGTWNIPALQHLLEEVLPCNTEVRDFEVEQPSAGNGHRTLLLNARRLHHPDGAIRLILLTFEDVTARRQLEHALQLTLAELERSNQDLESFASIASHDLQEPLRKIRAFGERLEAACEGQLPEKGRDYLARMTVAAARMQRLITDLLVLARVTTRGKTWREVDLGLVLTEVMADLEDALARSGGRVDAGPLPTLEADPTQMRQLFQNLIGNALKFRGEHAPAIRVTAADGRGALIRPGLRSDDPVCTIVVADNGIGFDQKYEERIFRPFERLHARDAFEGTGIGLALCQRIVRRHGGTIRAESEPGRGARFIVHLPARQKAAS